VFDKIIKNYRAPKQDDISYKYDRNNYIRATELLVIGPDGEKLGLMSKDEALKQAEEAGLDLVEIAAGATPPVAKIISWSKFKYEQEKKKKQSKAKSNEQKEIWFKSFIGDGDIEHKLKKVKEFIDEKHQVRLTIKRKGRPNYEQMKILMEKLLEKTAEYAQVTSEPKFAGGNYSAVISAKV
jgi:translation initiation factor IF-3